jgi:tRNA-2-methylthio-N6-dimethylallyladenosine synthase
MNRKHTADDYTRLVGRIRQTRPDIALSTDIIVGFPGETEDDFEATQALVREIGFAQAFSFKYSARPGTPAATLPHQVPASIAGERLQRLQTLIDGCARAFDARTVGRTFPILVERRGRKPGQVAGRSPYNQPVHAEGTDRMIGQIVEVDIVAAGSNSLTGVIKSGFEWREPLQAAV